MSELSQSDLEILRSKIRIIYSEIIRGFSFCRELNCYLKHFTDEDLAAIDQEVNEARTNASEKGLPSQKERIKELVDNGSWTLEEEAELESLDKHVKVLKMNMDNAHGKLKDPYLADIEEAQEKASKIRAKRELSVGLTLEKYTDKRRSDLYVYYSFYTDLTAEKNFWTREDFDDLDQEEVNDAVFRYNEIMEQFSHANIKRIATQAYFLNKFFITSGDPMVYFGKSAIQLTQYQSELLSQGRMYKNVLEHNEKGESPPEAWYDDPDKLVNWYYSKMNMDSGLPTGKTPSGTADKDWSGASTVPGASLNDLQKMSKGEMTVDLNAEIQKVIDEKGKANLYDILKIHGEDVSMIDQGD